MGDGGRLAWSGFDRVRVQGGGRQLRTIERRSIHAGNHAGCCASCVEIERRTLENDQRGAANRGATEMSSSESWGWEKEHCYIAAFTRSTSDQGRVRDSTAMSLIV